IARPRQPRHLGRAPGHDLADPDAAHPSPAEVVPDDPEVGLAVARLRPAPGRSRDLALPAAQILEEGAHVARGNGEADAVAAPGAREDRRVDPDDVPARADERATRISWIDRRVRLDQAPDRASPERRTGRHVPERADDALGERALEAEGTAEREHRLSD